MASDLRDRLQRSLSDSFTIERELGGGGMSRVYLATDRSLGRQVVIKVLSAEATGDVSAQRFEREIRLAATLQQANIVPLLSAGSIDDVPYYTLPFVEGASLRNRLGSGRLPLQSALGALRDVARALAYAHDKGVVHRDIKPENVLLSGDAAVVTDFGIAKAIQNARVDATGQPVPGTVTQVGTAVGTPGYMAPEQISADPGADHRVDIYAFGCLAYELLAGSPPFAASSTSALFAAHLGEIPEPLSQRNPEVPEAVAALVDRCLSKDPADRPDSARVLLAVLEGSHTAPHPLRRAVLRLSRRQRIAAITTGIVVAVVAGAAVAVSKIGPAEQPIIAVVPFLNLAADTGDEYIVDGLADGLATSLGKTRGLRVVSRTLGYRFRGRRDLSAADIANALGATHVVMGAFRRTGDARVYSAQLVTAAGNSEIWAETFDRGLHANLVQDSIARAIVATLLGSDALSQRSAPATSDAVASEQYMRGRFLLQRRGQGVRRAIALFDSATARDSNFALAHAARALALELLPYFAPVDAHALGEQALRSAARALAIDSTIAEAHTAIAMAHQHEYRWAEAEASYRRALRLGPDEPDAHIQYGRFLFYTGRIEESIPHFQRARQLDPLSAVASGWLGHTRFVMGDDGGLTELRRAVELDSTNPPALTFYAGALTQLGRVDEARQISDRLRRTVPSWRRVAAGSLAELGDTAPLNRAIRELERETDTSPQAFINLAIAAASIGDTARALDALEAATARRDIWPTFYSAGTRQFDSIRHLPRFAEILRKVGLNVAIFTSPLGGRRR